MTRIAVRPDMLRWARDRARLDVLALTTRFPKLQAWEAEETQPTLKQLEDYARATHAPIGYFFLPAPPVEPMPIPDFRTVADRAIARPSPDLLDTVYACQERQAWYRDFALINGEPPLAFVGALNTGVAAVQAAAQIRQLLGFEVDARRECRTWAEALRLFIEQAERVGVMVMVSGVVLNNNYRHLDPQEFRGFALADDRAPLVFINGADSKSAQMFTLAHELAHLWLGQSALSDVRAGETAGETSGNAIETWCNQVAAELLVPMDCVLDRASADSDEPVSGGSGFFRTMASRVGKRFARALVESTLEGRTLYRDAFRMLGIAKTSTFNEFGRSLNFAV